jgi:hypothetical protein
MIRIILYIDTDDLPAAAKFDYFRKQAMTLKTQSLTRPRVLRSSGVLR